MVTETSLRAARYPVVQLAGNVGCQHVDEQMLYHLLECCKTCCASKVFS